MLRRFIKMGEEKVAISRSFGFLGGGKHHISLLLPLRKIKLYNGKKTLLVILSFPFPPSKPPNPPIT